MHYYSHHLGDYAKDTGHLSATEHGVYRLMLDHYYSTENQIPAEKTSLFRIARAQNRAEKEAVLKIAREFFSEEGGKLINKRVEAELAEYHRLKAKNKENGMKGGRPKRDQKETQWVNSGFDLGFENETQTKAIPIPNNQEPSNTPLSPDGGYSFSDVEVAVSSILSSRAPKAFSAAERNSLKELRSRISDDELISEAEAIKRAKDDGWQYFARTRPVLLNKWESQADLAKAFNNETPLIPRNNAPLSFR